MAMARPAAILTVLLLAACGPAASPADTPRPDPGPQTAPTPRHSEADTRFMQGMIVHHAQALEMTALVPDRSERPDIRLMARRIAAGQADEIALMERWLRNRGEEVPELEAHHDHGHHGHAHGDHQAHAGMAGMLSPEQMARLEAASGPEFDRLFLELMIFHHEGAIAMVRELFASAEGGQETEAFQIASHVQADQAVEIERMRGMLTGPR